MISWEEAGLVVVEALKKAGFEAYVVGGAVRDKWMGRPIRDVDVCTNASPQDLKSIFPKTHDVGINHGTIIIPIKGKGIEVSEYRTKAPLHEKSLEEDLSLRDFTCNAMAMNRDGTIVDPFNGKDSIDKKVLKTVGNTQETFFNDPLRLLRAIRFSIQLDFILEDEVTKFIEGNADIIQQPAIERIAGELDKIATTRLTPKSLSFLITNKVIRSLGDIFSNKENILSSLEKNDTFFIQGILEFWSLAAYSQDLQKSMGVLRRYKRSKKIENRVIKIIEAINKGLHEEMKDYDLYLLGDECLDVTEKLILFFNKEAFGSTKTYLNRYNSLPIKNKRELAIDGNMLKKKFPDMSGIWIGQTLELIEKSVINRDMENDEVIILEWVKMREQTKK
ncbi:MULTISPECIES: CCA tRNA nucleotidyltransferase [Bacillaceae]|uniref:CCA tRNA nucleotidyltransferase n=1 Tax=Evansella alkalicola TaxID=745819 RepID=A0ABS6JZA0_9BACI|nr:MULTISPECIES: CCA tRNA nucleotidyltransferase [Bacillaceae]MBU9723920.1 CCA tRNA nucleotidyltransferase [Bacillus alkalicola]